MRVTSRAITKGRQHLWLVFGMLLVAFAAFTHPALASTADPCAAYRSTSLPTNSCGYQATYQRAYNSLTQGQRNALSNDPASVRNFYGCSTSSCQGSSGIYSAMLRCYEEQQLQISQCKSSNSEEERRRADSLLRSLNEQFGREHNALKGAFTDANATATAAQARQQQAGGLGSTQAGANTSSGTQSGAQSAPRTTTATASPTTGGERDRPRTRTRTSGGSGAGDGPEARAPGCAEDVATAQDQGRGLGLARAATIFDRTLRNISAEAAMEGALCIGRLMEKINEVVTAFNAIVSSLNNPLIAVLVAVASQILGQIINQLIDNVINAVCNAVNEITDAIENRLQNALCINSDIDLGLSPARFDIDLDAMQCSGWSIDLLTGDVLGQPIEGANVDWGQVRDAAGNASNPANNYQQQQNAIRNNRSLSDAQRTRQLYDLCRNYGRTDCGPAPGG